MKDFAHVVIVGFPNVGKSTLFNRLLRQKKSLVHFLPGMTRDTVSSLGSRQGKKFILTDTGGFFDADKEPLDSKIREKAWEAARRADILLFVLDGRRELLPAEEELFLSLKKLGKPIFVVVNKIDTESQESQIGDFYRLGEETVFAVSAEHKRNISLLEERLIEALPSGSEREEEAKTLQIAIIGRINVGKSSLINRLCGEERLIVSEIPGTTRDSTDTLIFRNKKAYSLLDTAGIRKLSRTQDEREKASIIIAKKNMAGADVLCLVMDILEFPTRQDAAIAQLAQESGKPLLLALNKWDLIQDKAKAADAFQGQIFRRLEFVSYAPVLFVSALSGKGVVKILDLADEVYHNSFKRIETSPLNDFLARVLADHPPQTKSGRRIKIKYMIQKDVHPPAFLLFANTRASLAPAYQKFFVNLLREEFDFWGSPLRLFLREG